MLRLHNRASASGDGMNIQHWHTHLHAGHLGVEAAFIDACIVGDIGRSSTHIKADNLVMAGVLCGFDRSDNAACRAGKNGVFTLKDVGRGQAAMRLHKL